MLGKLLFPVVRRREKIVLLAVVEAESGIPSQRLDMDGLEEGFSTMTLFEGACLHSDKGAFRGEEVKLLLPADDRFLADMDLGEALQYGVIDSLRGAQTFLHAKKNVEALLSQRSSLLEDKQGLEERVEALKKELENERAKHEVAMKEVVDEMRAAAGVFAKEQVARAKLVMMKQYETGKHKNWRVKEEIDRCIFDLGDEAAPILKRFEEADEVSGDDFPES